MLVEEVDAGLESGQFSGLLSPLVKSTPLITRSMFSK